MSNCHYSPFVPASTVTRNISPAEKAAYINGSNIKTYWDSLRVDISPGYYYVKDMTFAICHVVEDTTHVWETAAGKQVR